MMVNPIYRVRKLDYVLILKCKKNRIWLAVYMYLLGQFIKCVNYTMQMQ